MKQKVTARPVSEASQGVRDPTDVTVRGLLARSMSTRRFRVTLLAGSLVSVFGAAILGAWLDAREHARFEAQADATLAQVERGFVAPLEALHAIAAFHDASPDADVASFARFAHPLLARHKSLAALEWALVVTDAGRDALEARLSQGRAIPFSIREPDAKGDLLPSPRRDLYAPLLRLEPALPTLEGLNVAFDTPRRRLFDETVRRRAMTVSTKFRLVEDPEGVFSVAVMEPIYESPTDRLPRALGIALYRLEPLVRAATEGAHLEGMWLALFDEDETLRADERVLFATGGEAASGRTMNRRLDFGGKHWRATVVRPRALPLVPIVAGLGAEAFAVAVAFMVGALAAARRSMEKERALTRLGEYTLLRILGKGGMGVVYEARHRLLRRRAAIKLISQDVASRAALERFDREVKTTSELSHPNTIAVFDYGRTAEGAFYYVMEYIEGLSLAQLVERYGPLPPARTSHLLGQVCAALGEAHDRGFVHRDIKPANVMVGTRGGIPDFVKVLDFGLVKERGKGADLTRDDALLGTPRYMAPEAFASPETVGPAADIYAVGCLAYYLLTGAHAFEDRTDPAAIAAHLVKEPPSARLLRADLPEAFDRVVRRCLERAPEARYQSTRQLARAFEKACTTSWTTAEAAEWWSTVELPSRSEEAASPATIELRV